MRQKDDWSVRRPRLAIENAEPVKVDTAMLYECRAVQGDIPNRVHDETRATAGGSQGICIGSTSRTRQTCIDA